MSRRGPDPERLFFGALVGTARRLAVEQGSIADAVTRIRALAKGQNDLLTEAAGIGVGAWSVDPGHPVDLLTAGLLAGSVIRLDLDVLQHWITVGRQRALSGHRYRA